MKAVGKSSQEIQYYNYQKTLIGKLPNELIWIIFRCLEPKDFWAVSATCRPWSIIGKEESLWKFFCEKAGVFMELKPSYLYQSLYFHTSCRRRWVQGSILTVKWRDKLALGARIMKMMSNGNVLIGCFGHKIQFLKLKWNEPQKKISRDSIEESNSTSIKDIVELPNNRLLLACLDSEGKLYLKEIDLTYENRTYFSKIRCLGKRSMFYLKRLSNGSIVAGGVSGAMVLNPNNYKIDFFSPWKDRVWSIEELPNHQVAFGSEYGKIIIWDIERNQCIRVLNGQGLNVNCLTLLSNGLLVSGTSTGELVIWDLNTGKSVRKFKWSGGVPSITSITELSYGRLAVGFFDATVRIVSSYSETCIQEIQLKKVTGCVKMIQKISHNEMIVGTSNYQFAKLYFSHKS